MITLQEILSDVQSEVNDLALERIQLGEWIDIVNNSIMDIAEATQIYIGRYTTVPNNALLWTNGTYIIGDKVIDSSNNYYICILAGTNIPLPVMPLTNNANWVLANWIPYTCIIPYTDNLGNVLSPFKFLRVSRGTTTGSINMVTWMEAREYSIQSISNTLAGNDSFAHNHILLDSRHFASHFSNPITNVNDDRVLIFAQPFNNNESISIDFIQSTPFKLTQWSNSMPLSIPDFLRNAIKFAVQWRAFERLFSKGDDNMIKRADRAKMFYDTYLRKAIGYSHNLKDVQSTYQSTPMRWLPE